MSDKLIYTIPPDVFTSTPGRTFYDIPASASGWYHSTGHRYKTGSGSDNVLKTDDGVEFSANYQMDGSYGSWVATGNPCSGSGFEHSYSTNTNTPGYSVCVLATGSRNNLKSWNSSSIPSSSEGMGMNNVVGCTLIGDNTGSEDSKDTKLYICNVAFIYRASNGTPYTYTLKNKLSGISHWNDSHTRSTKIQGGYVDRNNIGNKRFFGIVIQYWAAKGTGTKNRWFSHKTRNLKFIIGNTRNPSTSSNTSDRIVLESGTNTFSSDDRKIWTA